MFNGICKFFVRVWRVTCVIAHALWEVICWIVFPAVFGSLFYASVTKKIEISVLQICLVAIGLAPWILRLLARYLSEFNIGPKGISGKTKEAVKNKDEIDHVQPELFANAQPAESAFGKLLPQSKKVLRTLWKYQVEHFGPDDIRRWGFAVGSGASDYHEFSLGLLELLRQNLVSIDSRGFAFLTAGGIEFCKMHNAEITTYPSYYSHFSN